MPLTLSGTSGVLDNSGAFIAGTSVSASGTSVEFTGIPSWVKRVTFMVSGISTNGTSNPFLIQIGPSGGVETTNYIGGSGAIFGANGCNGTTNSSGFTIQTDNSASNVINGFATISLLNASTNTWAATGTFCQSDRVLASYFAYSKSLAGALSRVRITTTNGTDTFDAGTVNILYE